MIEVFYFFYYQSVGDLHDVHARVPARAGALGPRDLDGVRGVAAAGAGGAAGVGVPGRPDAPPRSGAAHRGRRRVARVRADAVRAAASRPILAGWALYAMFAVAVGGLADALRGRARARRRRLRAAAAVGLGRLRRRVGRGRRAAVGARPRGGSAGAGRDVAGARRARSSRRSACAARASRPRARAPPTCARCWRDPRLRLLLVIAALHWICLAPYNVYFGVFLHDLGLAAAVVGPRLLDRRRRWRWSS